MDILVKSSRDCSSFDWPLIDKSDGQTQKYGKKGKLSKEGSTCGSKPINPLTFCFVMLVRRAGPKLTKPITKYLANRMTPPIRSPNTINKAVSASMIANALTTVARGTYA